MVSVIVPVHGGGESFRRCLESIAAARSGDDELIVVADGDSDGSWRLAENFDAIIVRTPAPQGPANARNLGAESAHGDILFFTDADVTIPPDALRQVAGAFEKEPGLAALIGSYDDTPDVPNFLSQYKNLFHHHTHQTAREDASTFWGACGAIRRRIFLEMGGFDATYRHPSIEDIELGYRLKSAGYEIRLLKSLQVKHLKHWRVASLLESDFLRRALPWTELILRDRRFINDLNLRFSSRASVPVAFGILGHHDGSAVVAPAAYGLPRADGGAVFTQCTALFVLRQETGTVVCLEGICLALFLLCLQRAGIRYRMHPPRIASATIEQDGPVRLFSSGLYWKSEGDQHGQPRAGSWLLPPDPAVLTGP